MHRICASGRALAMEHFAQSFEANEQNVEKNPADLKHMNTIHVSIMSRGVYGWFGYGV